MQELDFTEEMGKARTVGPPRRRAGVASLEQPDFR